MPIFSLQLQNPSGHTGMLLGHVVDMVPLQISDQIFSYLDPGIQYGGRSPDSGPEIMRILNVCNNLSYQNSDFLVYSHIFRVALFNGVCSNNPLCSYPPEIGWKTGSTYNE